MTIDTATLRTSVDLLALVGWSGRRRKARTNGGEWAGACPRCGGEDRFIVWPEAQTPGWFCRKCEKGGDAIAFLEFRDGLSFREACERLASMAGISLPETPSGPPKRLQQTVSEKPQSSAVSDVVPPAEDWQSDAWYIIEQAEACLWSDAGETALDWLYARGLERETVRKYRLGFNPRPQEIRGHWVDAGIIIPWLHGETVYQVKIRRGDRRKGQKYRAVAGGRPWLYGADQIAGRPCLALAEGELDAMLLAQECGDFLDAVSLGSASIHAIPSSALPLLGSAGRWLVAYDNDEEGERGTEALLERYKSARAVRVPAEHNDLTDAHLGGVNLRDLFQPNVWRASDLQQGEMSTCEQCGTQTHHQRICLTCMAVELGAERLDVRVGAA